MAVICKVKTEYGEDRDVYIRVNNAEVSNHGVPSSFIARGFVSEEAFRSGARFVWEKQYSLAADVSRPIWEQAYQTIKDDDEVIVISGDDS